MTRFVYKLTIELSVEAEHEEEAQRQMNRWLNSCNNGFGKIEQADVGELISIHQVR